MDWMQWRLQELRWSAKEGAQHVFRFLSVLSFSPVIELTPLDRLVRLSLWASMSFSTVVSESHTPRLDTPGFGIPISHSYRRDLTPSAFLRIAGSIPPFIF